ncbi:6-pyruvoyl trahydropterin synthase family protein [Poriferisphaera sp. WC338]|uniref:6-pyruvoyl trahydropterin synthase family protein n=1 Tax=Poriferisphaera sp. WC338 TaxID=3425129 RepID=UPI003D81AB7B
MYEIEIVKVFRAGHALRLPNGGLEDYHKHDWQVTVCVGSGERLDALETVMDFHVLEKVVDEVLAAWDGKNLNKVEGFRDGDQGAWNPSAERVAEMVAKRVDAKLREMDKGEAARVLWAQTTEAPGCIARYRMK